MDARHDGIAEQISLGLRPPRQFSMKRFLPFFPLLMMTAAPAICSGLDVRSTKGMPQSHEDEDDEKDDDEKEDDDYD